MSEPTWLSLARTDLGTHEVSGSSDNPKIMQMYADVGHSWVAHDETAWCAAAVGSWLERNGIRSTRKLNARSYLNWGTSVPIANARPGDVVVFRRGNSAWQGHVAFYLSHTSKTVRVLGGNQADRVSIASYPMAKLLGVRRAPGAGKVDIKVNPPAATKTIALRLDAKGYRVKALQERLAALGYFAGAVDSDFGPLTRAAVVAFQTDAGLVADGVAGERTLTALDSAQLKTLSAARADAPNPRPAPAAPAIPEPAPAIPAGPANPPATAKGNPMLAGYKTYVVAAVMVALGVLSMLGIAIPGVTLPDDWFMVVLSGLGLGTLRAGISNG